VAGRNLGWHLAALRFRKERYLLNSTLAEVKAHDETGRREEYQEGKGDGRYGSESFHSATKVTDFLKLSVYTLSGILYEVPLFPSKPGRFPTRVFFWESKYFSQEGAHQQEFCNIAREL
jgi:hypothetical protein